MFPTKALAQDQKSEINEIIQEMELILIAIRMTEIHRQIFDKKLEKQAILLLQIQICFIQPFFLIIRNGYHYLKT